MDLELKMASVEAVPVARAAAILGRTRRTIYRKLKLGLLEQVPRKGRIWVSLRSISALQHDEYGATEQFDLFKDL